MQFLSYVINENTPTYGNRNQVSLYKKSDINKGDIANDSFISTTVHIGTHIDMPYHFYQDGQTVNDFDDNFWIFNNIVILEVEPKGFVIKNELIEQLNDVVNTSCEILIVKTGICQSRGEEGFWSENYGFHPDVYDCLIKKFPHIRVFGFDSISVSSLQNRTIGREAHKAFLNPKKPILLLEDMDLRFIDERTKLNQIIIAPLRIENCDGLPCTVMGF